MSARREPGASLSYAHDARLRRVRREPPGATTEGDLRKYVASASGVTPTFLRYSDGYSSNSGGGMYQGAVGGWGHCDAPPDRLVRIETLAAVTSTISFCAVEVVG
jgi:hypothetical protein